MLKDLLKNKKKTDKALSLFDGYVDIKVFKHSEDGNKKLIYHDTGDNTVTDWMRQALLLLLSGHPYSVHGRDGITKPNSSNRTQGQNIDGYCINGRQFIDSFDNFNPVVIQPNDGTIWPYSVFPTKVLLGTGLECSSWDEVETLSSNYAEWYNDILATYNDEGSVDINTAKNNFESLLSNVGNTYSSDGVTKSVTLNNPDIKQSLSRNHADFRKRLGVKGAIKTLYDGTNNTLSYLENSISDAGKLLAGKYRGAGRPCFIYFNRPAQTNDSTKEYWDDPSYDVYVHRDSSSDVCNQITFRIVLPSQTSGSGALGKYYPFNGYTFKEIGLFNDALFITKDNTESLEMPFGTLLAIKSIESFTKTADESVEFTWTLTI